MFHCARYGRRVREQILAFGVFPSIDRKSLTCIDNNIDNNTKIPEDGLLLYPVAVRAPTGHKSGNRDDVTLMTSLLSHPLAPSTLISLPVCFHITRRMHLRSIWKEGLIPGGLEVGHRMCTFFNPYAPWDQRSWGITKSVDTRGGGFICLYIPTETLMVEFGARLTDSGQIVTDKIVPFSKIRGGWIQDTKDPKDPPWHLLFVPSGDDQVVRSGTVKSKTIVTKESVLRIANQCINAEKQPYDELTMEAMHLVNQLEKHLIKEGGQELYMARIKIIDYIVERKAVSEAGCRHYPHCLNETPTKFSVCLECWTELESHGVRPYRIRPQQEEDADEANRKELDEEVRRQEESMFNDTVHEAQETAKQNDYGFNPDEVDYDEEDEEMKQEAEEDEIVEDEDEEMEVPPETEEPVKVPAWALNLEAGSKKIPVKGLINNDVSETAAHLFDNAIIAKIIAMYKFYYKQRVTMKPEEYHDVMTNGPLGRIDLDGFCPYTGEDEDGSLKRPSEDELNALFEDKAKEMKWSKGVKLYNGRPKEMLMDVVLTLETFEKMMEYLVLAGYTPESMSFLIPMTKQQNTAEENKVMREKISDFLRRLLKGAYPDAEHYTYFRTGNHGFPNCIDIPAFSVFLSRKRKLGLNC